MRRSIRFVFRGVVHDLTHFEPTRTLLEWLREDQHATGTKEGCSGGDCGACTIVLARFEDGVLRYDPVNACIALLGQVDGAEIITVEDLAEGGHLHPVQQAMVQHHGAQCGFCTAGIIMSLFAAYHADKPLDVAGINECLAGNLCRCTGYRPILDAASEAFAREVNDHFARDAAHRIARLEALHDPRDAMIGEGAQFFALPASLETAAELAAQNPEATVLAGATDVGLWITKDLEPLPQIIALSRVRELREIRETAEGVYLGAMVTHRAALPVLTRLDADLGALMQRFASRQIRALGTIGGNIANASPLGDLPPALMALGARLHLRHGKTTRDLPLEEFFIAYGKQAKAPGELIAGVSIPALGADTHFRSFKISKRLDEDISIVTAAFCVQLDGRQIQSARIAFGAMGGGIARRARQSEQALVGCSIDDPASWDGALRALGTDYSPSDNPRGSSHYRARLARALLGKALIEISGASGRTRLMRRGENAITV